MRLLKTELLKTELSFFGGINKLNLNNYDYTTYLDIFREFSHMASNNPEKLKRRSLHFRHSFR
uniref:Uncharacterized protein n=1 Tax=Cyprinodon variegatus TaxID=28743 RepID=A0A3Q2DI48_CYPVA